VRIPPSQARLVWWHIFSIFAATTIIWVGIYKTWGFWRPQVALWGETLKQKRDSNLEWFTTSWSLILEMVDVFSDLVLAMRVSEDPTLDVMYTIISLVILITVVTFDMFLIYRRCYLLSEVRNDMVVPEGWLGWNGELFRRARRGYENQLLTIYTTFLEDIPIMVLTAVLILREHRDNIILLSSAISMLCLGQKLAAIEKLFMWKSIGIGQHKIKENRGRRVHEKTLEDFLSSVEEDWQNLKRMKISSSFRRVTQPELMMSMSTTSYDDYMDCEEDSDYREHQLNSYRSFNFSLPQIKPKTTPAETAARIAFPPQ